MTTAPTTAAAATVAVAEDCRPRISSLTACASSSTRLADAEPLALVDMNVRRSMLAAPLLARLSIMLERIDADG